MPLITFGFIAVTLFIISYSSLGIAFYAMVSFGSETCQFRIKMEEESECGCQWAIFPQSVSQSKLFMIIIFSNLNILFKIRALGIY